MLLGVAIKFCRKRDGVAGGNRARFISTGRCRYHDRRKAAGFSEDDVCRNVYCNCARLTAKHWYWECDETKSRKDTLRREIKEYKDGINARHHWGSRVLDIDKLLKDDVFWSVDCVGRIRG